MGEFSLPHILIVLIILLVFFGPSRLPGLGQSLGKAVRGLKEGLNDASRAMNETAAPKDRDAQVSTRSKQDGGPHSDGSGTGTGQA